MATERIKVELLGTTFHVESAEEGDYLRSVVTYLQDKVNEVRGQSPVADPIKVALLAGLNLVDELFKAREGRPVSGSEIGQIAESLIERIDRSLEG
jgi:cell division protein ZapA (FtsZ GTPase activity inhibitor)